MEADQTQKGTDFLTKDKGITYRVMRTYPPVAKSAGADWPNILDDRE